MSRASASAHDPAPPLGGRARGLHAVAAALLATLATLIHAGCGGSDAASPRSPAGGKSSDTLDGAAGDLDRAEGELNAVLGYQYAAPPGYGTPAAGQQPQPGTTPAPAPPPEPATPAPTDAPPRAELSTDPCAVACRALDSMGRAAEHICGLAGETDSRCGAARSRVQAASERVRARCTCA